MSKEQAAALVIGQVVEHQGNKARVIQPAMPRYVMIEWTDTRMKECPFTEWMDDFKLVQ